MKIPLPLPLCLLPVLVAASCESSGAPASGQAGGSFELRRTGEDAAVILDGPASATWCPDDSTLTVIAVVDAGSGGFATRVPWPLSGPEQLRVNHTMSGLLVATLAWRPLGDSANPALMADSGMLIVSGDDRLEGSLTASAPRDTTRVGLEGAFSGIPVRKTCPPLSP